jgi:hypothetical protein
MAQHSVCDRCGHLCEEWVTFRVGSPNGIWAGGPNGIGVTAGVLCAPCRKEVLDFAFEYRGLFDIVRESFVDDGSGRLHIRRIDSDVARCGTVLGPSAVSGTGQFCADCLLSEFQCRRDSPVG